MSAPNRATSVVRIILLMILAFNHSESKVQEVFETYDFSQHNEIPKSIHMASTDEAYATSMPYTQTTTKYYMALKEDSSAACYNYSKPVTLIRSGTPYLPLNLFTISQNDIYVGGALSMARSSTGKWQVSSVYTSSGVNFPDCYNSGTNYLSQILSLYGSSPAYFDAGTPSNVSVKLNDTVHEYQSYSNSGLTPPANNLQPISNGDNTGCSFDASVAGVLFNSLTPYYSMFVKPSTKYMGYNSNSGSNLFFDGTQFVSSSTTKCTAYFKGQELVPTSHVYSVQLNTYGDGEVCSLESTKTFMKCIKTTTGIWNSKTTLDKSAVYDNQTTSCLLNATASCPNYVPKTLPLTGYCVVEYDAHYLASCANPSKCIRLTENGEGSFNLSSITIRRRALEAEQASFNQMISGTAVSAAENLLSMNKHLKMILDLSSVQIHETMSVEKMAILSALQACSNEVRINKMFMMMNNDKPDIIKSISIDVTSNVTIVSGSKKVIDAYPSEDGCTYYFSDSPVSMCVDGSGNCTCSGDPADLISQAVEAAHGQTLSHVAEINSQIQEAADNLTALREKAELAHEVSANILITTIAELGFEADEAFSNQIHNQVKNTYQMDKGSSSTSFSFGSASSITGAFKSLADDVSSLGSSFSILKYVYIVFYILLVIGAVIFAVRVNRLINPNKPKSAYEQPASILQPITKRDYVQMVNEPEENHVPRTLARARAQVREPDEHSKVGTDWDSTVRPTRVVVMPMLSSEPIYDCASESTTVVVQEMIDMDSCPEPIKDQGYLQLVEDSPGHDIKLEPITHANVIDAGFDAVMGIIKDFSGKSAITNNASLGERVEGALLLNQRRASKNIEEIVYIFFNAGLGFLLYDTSIINVYQIEGYNQVYDDMSGDIIAKVKLGARYNNKFPTDTAKLFTDNSPSVNISNTKSDRYTMINVSVLDLKEKSVKSANPNCHIDIGSEQGDHLRVRTQHSGELLSYKISFTKEEKPWDSVVPESSAHALVAKAQQVSPDRSIYHLCMFQDPLNFSDDWNNVAQNSCANYPDDISYVSFEDIE